MALPWQFPRTPTDQVVAAYPLRLHQPNSRGHTPSQVPHPSVTTQVDAEESPMPNILNNTQFTSSPRMPARPTGAQAPDAV